MTTITKPVTYGFSGHGDHIIASIKGRWCLMDTGAGTCLGVTPTFDFGGRSFSCVSDFFGVTADRLTEYVGHPIDYLVGLEVLSRFPFFLNWDNHEITFYPEGYEFMEGQIVPLKNGLMGQPLKFPFKFNSRDVEAILDTGAPVSYMPEPEGEVVGKTDDFFPTFGRFETPMYRNKVTFGNREFEMPFGVFPDDFILKRLTPWVCGGAFLKSGPLGFDLTNRRLHLFSNK